MNNGWKMFFLLGGLAAISIWLAIAVFPKRQLKVIACDVGQGDAILITYGSTQILSDGGPNSSVLDCLSENMAFWDRQIELVLISHPQVDHFGGIIDVMERYDVVTLMTTGLKSGSQEYQVLESLVGGSETEVKKVHGGQEYGLGLIHLDILWPTETYILAHSVESNRSLESVLGDHTSNEDPNEFSLVTLITFEDFDILLTGDIGPEVSNIIAEKIKDGRYNDIEVLKVPHHGSKNGMTEKFLDVVSPDMAIISVGKDNRFGHPNKEILEMLVRKGITIYRTDEIGEVVIKLEDN
ncbi:MBL fold metallo-hydrolase [Candidatus Woesebacteria bacterium]|nr:MBL fold metallo-hydrolase [Candidatus Woesebacteria bacterium]